MSYVRFLPVCLMLAAPAASQAQTAPPRADICQAPSAQPAQESKRKLLGGFMRGLSSAAPLIGGRSSAMQAVTTVAGQTLNAASQVDGAAPDARRADCNARAGS